MIKRTGNKNCIEGEGNKKFPFSMVWKNIDGFIEDANTKDRNIGLPASHERASRRADDGWTGGTFADTLDKAQNGWKEGTESARKIVKRLSEEVDKDNSPDFLSSYGVSGCEPDIDRYLSGVPENMVHYSLDARRELSSRIVRIFVNVSGACFYDTSQFMNRAAAVMAMCWEIHLQGNSPEIWIGQLISNRGGEGKLLSAACLLKAGDPFDEDRMSFFLGHPAVLRRFIFSVQENMDQKLRDDLSMSSYGCCIDCGVTNIKKALKLHVEDISGEFDLVIPSLDETPDLSEPKMAARWVDDNIKAITKSKQVS